MTSINPGTGHEGPDGE